MFKLLFKIFQPREARMKEWFSFLLVDYGFRFAKANLGDAVDKDGKFFFYGPVEAYYIYNKNVCINILYLTQRDEYEIYITDSYINDQIYIRNGTRISGDPMCAAAEIESAVSGGCGIYGRKI